MFFISNLTLFESSLHQEAARIERALNASVRLPADAEKYRLEKVAQAEKKRIILEAEAQAEAERVGYHYLNFLFIFFFNYRSYECCDDRANVYLGILNFSLVCFLVLHVFGYFLHGFQKMFQKWCYRTSFIKFM